MSEDSMFLGADVVLPPIDSDIIKLLMVLSFPLIAFLSLIIWLAISLRKDRSLSVVLKFLGLSLSVTARHPSDEKRSHR